jgi:hypothetical protein
LIASGGRSRCNKSVATRVRSAPGASWLCCSSNCGEAERACGRLMSAELDDGDSGAGRQVGFDELKLRHRWGCGRRWRAEILTPLHQHRTGTAAPSRLAWCSLSVEPCRALAVAALTHAARPHKTGFNPGRGRWERERERERGSINAGG